MTFSEIMGHNARMLRGNHTMDEVAQIVRKKLGLRWSSGNVSTIEAGASSVTITNLLILSHALGELTGRPVTPLDLLNFEGEVKTGIRNAAILDADFKTWFQHGNPHFNFSTESPCRIDTDSTPAEDRAAKSLGMPVSSFRFWAMKLWGQSFEDKRDELAGKAASPQKKGRISRELKDQILECYEKELKSSRT